jgi:hypothetical protein
MSSDTKSATGRWLRIAAVALPTGPIAILLHELGHLVFYLVFRTPGTALHYASADWASSDRFWELASAGNLAGAAALVPLRVEGFSLLGGILMTYLTVFACVVAARRTPRPFVIALGLAATSRLVSAVLVLGVLIVAVHAHPGTDEARLAMVTGIPMALTCAVSVLVLVGGWIGLIRAIPRGQRVALLVPIVVGIATGIALYMTVVGPRLLP